MKKLKFYSLLLSLVLLISFGDPVYADWPVAGTYPQGLSDDFGPRNLLVGSQVKDWHGGIDFPASYNADVVSTVTGKIYKIRDYGTIGWGYSVWVKTSANYIFVYAHLIKDSCKLKVDDDVTSAAVIGKADSTGYSTGNHLHLTVYNPSIVKINPLSQYSYTSLPPDISALRICKIEESQAVELPKSDGKYISDTKLIIIEPYVLTLTSKDLNEIKFLVDGTEKRRISFVPRTNATVHTSQTTDHAIKKATTDGCYGVRSSVGRNYFKYNWTAYEDGEYKIKVVATTIKEISSSKEVTVVLDATPPTVDSPAVAWPTVPKEGARNVSKNTDIVVYFSEKMDKSVEPDIFFTISPEVSGGFSWSEWEVNGSTGSILTFNPEGELETGIYTVNVSTEAKDLAGNGLDGDKDGDTGPNYRWSFEVNDMGIWITGSAKCSSLFHNYSWHVPYPNPAWSAEHPQEFNGEVICSGCHPYPWRGTLRDEEKGWGWGYEEFATELNVKIKNYPVEEGTVIDFNPVFLGAGGGVVNHFGGLVKFYVWFEIKNGYKSVAMEYLYDYYGAEYNRVFEDEEYKLIPNPDFHPEEGIKDPEPIHLYEKFRKEWDDAEIIEDAWEIEINCVAFWTPYEPAWLKIGLNGLNLPGIASNPDSVACLSVIDSPDDIGGNVRVSWQGSSDIYFNSYNIYSSGNKIFSVKGLKPVVKIGEMDKNSYDIPALGDGFYYYGVTVENRLKMESNCISSNKAVRAVNNLIDTEESPCTIWSGFDEKTKVIVKQGENNGVYVNILEPEEEKERLITNANVYPPGEAMISLDKGNKLDSTKREFKSSKVLCGRQIISIPYANSIDGCLEDNLQVYVLNERDEKWEKLPDKCIIDKGEKIISCEVEGKEWDKGMVYRIYGAFSVSSDLKNVVVYPIPYKVGSGGRFGGSGISFKNLTSPAEIRIYNIAGELVFKEKAIDSSGYYEWDITNKDGRQVASGVYVYLITNDLGQKKTGRMAIIK